MTKYFFNILLTKLGRKHGDNFNGNLFRNDGKGINFPLIFKRDLKLRNRVGAGKKRLKRIPICIDQVFVSIQSGTLDCLVNYMVL